MAKCSIAPISGFQSTNLNNKIDSFNRLGDRILRSLGYPTVNVEIHRDQLYENISIANEYFTKFAGYTREYLIFDSNLYKKDFGIKLDDLFTLQGSNSFSEQFEFTNVTNPTFTKQINLSSDISYIALSSIPGTTFSEISSLSAATVSGIGKFDIVTQQFINEVNKFDTTAFISPGLSAHFESKVPLSFTVEGTVSGQKDKISFLNSYDYDLLDYRKVIDVKNFTEGSSTGINTLFTIEQTLAQQTYFSYAMGNYGFDLVSWYTLKNWLETREKLLAIERTFDFDPRTQVLRMYPQPGASNDNVRFYGVLDCYVERPIRDVIKELWVYQYSLALSKIVVGRIRGKYQGTQLFGGGGLNDSLLQEGLSEKAELEQQLMEGTPGQGDADPPLFFVG